MSDQSINNGETNGDHERDSEETMSLAEIIQQSEEMEDIAVAVLGASDRDQCSYDQGYIKRQALYACLTCNHPDLENYTEAGICLACSLKCHADHDLVELYTKRNFRCDCGNKKFALSGTHCRLQPIKSDTNVENKYNPNFRGLYCVCARPYPDPEEDEDENDDMIQCVVCEDWLHGRHTENDTIDHESEALATSDFVCAACTKKCGFLAHYEELMLKGTVMNESVPVSAGASVCNELETASGPNDTDEHGGQNQNVDEYLNGSGNLSSTKPNGVENYTGDEIDSGVGAGDSPVYSGGSSVANGEGLNITKQLNPENGNPLSSSDYNSTCYLDLNPADISVVTGGTWWVKDWRQRLCKCEKCLATYGALDVLFLVDPEDPLEVYEAQGRKKAKDNPGPLPGADLETLFGEMNHVQQMEVAHGLNELKDGIAEMVARVHASGRTDITRADVQVLFEDLKNKRRRLNDNIPPDSCR